MGKLVAVVAASLAGMVLSSSARGQGYYVDSPLVTIASLGSTVVNGKFRASAANFDQSVATGSATGVGNTLGYNLGNLATISANTYNFTFTHTAGQGYRLTMVTGGFTSIVAYGSGFAPALPTNAPGSVAVLSTNQLFTAPASGTNIAATSLPAYNSIRIEARASADNAGAPAEQVAFTNLTFSSPGLTLIDGALDNGTVSTSFPGTTEVVGGVTNASGAGFWYQRIVAETNLNEVDWTVSATVQLQRNGAGDGESWRFVVYGQPVDFTAAPIPEPASAAVLAAACALAAARRRRR